MRSSGGCRTSWTRARPREVRLTVGFRLTGNPSGEVERYLVRVDRGAATVTAGDAGDAGERDATVTCEGHDFLRLATGHLHPVFGVLRGQLKVRGDQVKALQLSSVIDIPQAAAQSSGRSGLSSDSVNRRWRSRASHSCERQLEAVLLVGA